MPRILLSGRVSSTCSGWLVRRAVSCIRIDERMPKCPLLRSTLMFDTLSCILTVVAGSSLSVYSPSQRMKSTTCASTSRDSRCSLKSGSSGFTLWLSFR